MNRIYETIKVTKTIWLFDSIRVVCFYSFWKYNYLEFLSAEVGKYITF